MTRNERKRKALAKRLMLEQAVKEAFASAKSPTLASSLDTHPTYSGRTVGSATQERSGVVISVGGKRKFSARDERMLEPLKGDWRERRAVGYFGGKRLLTKR